MLEEGARGPVEALALLGSSLSRWELREALCAPRSRRADPGLELAKPRPPCAALGSPWVSRQMRSFGTFWVGVIANRWEAADTQAAQGDSGQSGVKLWFHTYRLRKKTSVGVARCQQLGEANSQLPGQGELPVVDEHLWPTVSGVLRVIFSWTLVPELATVTVSATWPRLLLQPGAPW